jgi:excisionase family DNA binding protein
MSVKYSRLAVSIHPPAKPDVTDRLYTAKEVAAKLGVSERWVRDHATRRQPRLRAVKLGSLLRFQWADVHEFIQAQITGNDFTLRRNHASIEPFSATELRGHTGER